MASPLDSLGRVERVSSARLLALLESCNAALRRYVSEMSLLRKVLSKLYSLHDAMEINGKSYLPRQRLFRPAPASMDISGVIGGLWSLPFVITYIPVM
jgi:hypothetical protein